MTRKVNLVAVGNLNEWLFAPVHSDLVWRVLEVRFGNIHWEWHDYLKGQYNVTRSLFD